MIGSWCGCAYTAVLYRPECVYSFYLSLVVRESIFLHSSILSSILYQLVACPQPSSVLQHLIEYLISCTPLPVRFVKLWQFFFLQHLIEHLISCTRFLSDSFSLAIFILQHLIEYLISCPPLPVRRPPWQFFLLQHLVEHLISCPPLPVRTSSLTIPYLISLTSINRFIFTFSCIEYSLSQAFLALFRVYPYPPSRPYPR